MCVLCHCQPIPTAYVFWMLLLIQVGSTVSSLISGCQGQKWGRLLLPAAKKRIHVIITLFSPRVNLQFRDDVNMCLRVLCFLEKVGRFFVFFFACEIHILTSEPGMQPISEIYRQQWPNIEDMSGCWLLHLFLFKQTPLPQVFFSKFHHQRVLKFDPHVLLLKCCCLKKVYSQSGIKITWRFWVSCKIVLWNISKTKWWCRLQ